MPKQTIDEYLMTIGMHPETVEMTRDTDRFRAAMQKAMRQDSPSFEMIPSYLSADGALPDGVPVLVLDAGGTNLRRALVVFREGKAVIDDLTVVPMPGTRGPLTKAEYLRAMVEFIRPLADRARYIGYCFSYTARVRPDHDAVLKTFNKDVEIRGTEGMLICAELDEAMRKAGLPGHKKWVLLNDTAASFFGGLKAGGTDHFSGTIGFILGTGTNTCYEERTAALTRYDLRGCRTARMLINMESGCYDGFAAGKADRLLHASDPQPGYHPYEKMVGGKYQGRLIWLTAELAADAGFFSPSFSAALKNTGAFATYRIDEFVRHPEQDGPIQALCAEPRDRENLIAIAEAIADRAARMIAVNFAAVLEQAHIGADPAFPALIVAEGSTFWHYSLFTPRLHAYIKSFVKDERGLHAEIRSIESANLIGSAAAALLNA